MQRARSKDQTPKQVYSTRIIKYNVVLEWMSSYIHHRSLTATFILRSYTHHVRIIYKERLNNNNNSTASNVYIIIGPPPPFVGCGFVCWNYDILQ